MAERTPGTDPRMRLCPACDRYVMPEAAGPKIGWGGPVLAVIALLLVLFGGPCGATVGFPILALAVAAIVVVLVIRFVPSLAGRPKCPICKGPTYNQ